MHSWSNGNMWYPPWPQADTSASCSQDSSALVSIPKPESVSYRRHSIHQNDQTVSPRLCSSSPTPLSLWDGSSPLTELSSPSPTLPAGELGHVKLEPHSPASSPHFIIEPFLPSPTVHKPSSQTTSHVHGRRSHSPVSQSELAEKLLQSQSLAPPTQVPLRATQATPDMRAMMDSFRLNPFAMHSKPRTDVYMTWNGEEPRPLDEEPCLIEWQLDGYGTNEMEDEVGLIVMDSIDTFSDASDDAQSSILQDSAIQDRKPLPLGSPSLCLTDSFSSSQTSLSSPELHYPTLHLDESLDNDDTGPSPYADHPEIDDVSGARTKPDRFSNSATRASGSTRLWVHSIASSSISSTQSSTDLYDSSSASQQCSPPHGESSGVPFPASSSRTGSSGYSSLYTCNEKRVHQQSTYDESGPSPRASCHRYPIDSMLNRGGHSCSVDSSSSHSVTEASSRKSMSFSGELPHACLQKQQVQHLHQHHDQQPPSAGGNHHPASIELPSLPACLSNGSSRPRALNQAPWPNDHPISVDQQSWSTLRRLDQAERAQPPPCRDDSCQAYPLYVPVAAAARRDSLSYSPHASLPNYAPDPSVPRVLVASKSTPSLIGGRHQSSAKGSTFPEPDNSYIIHRPSPPFLPNLRSNRTSESHYHTPNDSGSRYMQRARQVISTTQPAIAQDSGNTLLQTRPHFTDYSRFRSSGYHQPYYGGNGQVLSNTVGYYL
ncbi:hypothetical protein Moror_5023 [Moniliophthora roreri MCA 2997]|uniref:Uncharacterized protein n=1 Tax=Moniliophthora roreri (strain MCA 2997) TaxID=1381753 RepID=V2X0P9_MONRO|nr:hypothetical protein Moror_5023 [Moniliophthora roreri MCA 2997]